MTGTQGKPLAAVSVSREIITITCFDSKVQINRPEMPEWDAVQQAFKNALTFRP